MTVFEPLHMPPLGGATEWLNSEPHGPAELRGHVVVVDIWTLTCINWLRTEPYVRAWSQAYRDDGLVVIGIHTPEFSFEHEDRARAVGDEGAGDRLPGRGRQRLRDLERLRQPLLALYFIDADGIIRDHHFGEGRSGVARDSDIYDRGRGIGHCGKGRPWQRSLGGSLDGGASLARD
jgi:thiol-disulfide isomerase/thioredoxin